MSAKWLLLVICPVLLASPAWGQSPYQHRNQGMTIGALMGALTGAAIGDRNNEALAGAAIGTAVGALTGAAIGDSVDNDIARQEAYRQRQYSYQVSQSASIDQVISMSRAGVSDSVIVTHIHTHGVGYRLQPNDLIVLKQSGVSDVVIQAMQTARLASVPVLAPAPVYRDRVIVEEHYYVAPRYYPAYPAWHPYYPPPRPYPYRSGVHWGVTVGR
jgi:uncharacterized membrane protein